MLLLVRVYQMLSLRKPELDNGVYARTFGSRKSVPADV